MGDNPIPLYTFIDHLFFCCPFLQTPKATTKVKELKVDIFKEGGSKPNMFFTLHILPISVHTIQLLSGTMEKPSAPFSCEEFSLCFEFGRDRYFFFFLKFPL